MGVLKFPIFSSPYLQFYCIGGLENAIYLYRGVSKIQFLVYGGLETAILLYTGISKIQFFVMGGLENAIFCIGGLKIVILYRG